MATRRTVLTGLSALGLTGCAGIGLPGFYDAIVTKSGSGERRFASVAAAVAAAPGDKPFRILVTAGIWRERVVIDKPQVTLVGEGRDVSTIVFDNYAGTKAPDGQPAGPHGSATMVIRSPDFTAKHLTIANDFDYPAHMPPPVADDRTGASGSQATALFLTDGSDRAYFEDCRIPGWQDTLFTDAGRSLFRACKIEGCVDFIYGAGRAVFEACEILCRTRPGQDFNGFIAAPDTKRFDPYGLVFVHCRLTKDPGMAPHTVALGRPWRHTRTFADGRYGDPDVEGVTVYLHCWMDDHIVPEGWYPMGYNIKGGGRGMVQPEEARLFEFDSSGPGAGPASSRRRILSAAQAAAYEPRLVLDGWVPG